MSIAEILYNTLTIYIFILFARVILSFIPLFKPGWSPPTFLAPVVDLVYGVTEPPLQLLRRAIPQPMGLPIDLSFIALFILVQILRSIVAGAF